MSCEDGASVHVDGVDYFCDTLFVADRKWLLLVYWFCALSESQTVAVFVCVEENHSSPLPGPLFRAAKERISSHLSGLLETNLV